MGHAAGQLKHKLTPSSGHPKGQIGGQATSGKGTKGKLSNKLLDRKPGATETQYPMMNPRFPSENNLDLSQTGLGVGPNSKGSY